MVPANNNERDLPVAKNLSNVEGFDHIARLKKKVKKKAPKRKATKKAASATSQPATT